MWTAKGKQEDECEFICQPFKIDQKLQSRFTLKVSGRLNQFSLLNTFTAVISTYHKTKLWFFVFLRRAVGLTEGFWAELLFLEAGEALVVCSFFFRENMFTLFTENVPQIFRNVLNTCECENVFSCSSVTDSYFPIMRVQLLAPARALSSCCKCRALRVRLEDAAGTCRRA